MGIGGWQLNCSIKKEPQVSHILQKLIETSRRGQNPNKQNCQAKEMLISDKHGCLRCFTLEEASFKLLFLGFFLGMSILQVVTLRSKPIFDVCKTSVNQLICVDSKINTLLLIITLLVVLILSDLRPLCNLKNRRIIVYVVQIFLKP